MNEKFLQLLKDRVFIQVWPVDDWHNWQFQILAEDIMQPFWIAYTCARGEEYPSYEAALEAGVNKSYELELNK